ncbi:MAG TPA: ArsR family transcriptional regulator [Gemmatimonadaceae bacterium]|nr:ArsR family transcriptional regulator [Gemmatimonadaceae bacterium]
MAGRVDNRFFESTRGRIVTLLRRGPRTVEELAGDLELTDNAVRLHLGTLERDGIVQAKGVRRSGSVGKPATEYEIAAAAEPSFSEAYIPFLTSLLGAVGQKLGSTELRAVMRDVGHRLASSAPAPSGDPMARAERASQLLNALGGVTTVEREPGGRIAIKGCSCPLSVAVNERAEVCLAVQTMLRDVTGVAIREECDRSERPRCHFALP